MQLTIAGDKTGVLTCMLTGLTVITRAILQSLILPKKIFKYSEGHQNVNNTNVIFL